MTGSQGLFFDLLKVAVGARDELSRVPSSAEWETVMNEAERQSVLGVMLDGLERLPDSQRPPKLELLQWIGYAQMVEQNTAAMAKASEEVVNYFRENGFACTLLKGAAVGRYYANPARRTSGDVDIWVDGGRKKIYDFARAFDKDGILYGVNYHHIHFHLLEDVHTEVHIWPSFFCNPLNNARFQRFCEYYRPVKDRWLPSLAFDRVFILQHCYRHMCEYGLGLRQIMDYYYVLRTVQDSSSKFQDDTETVKWIKELGMERFARGMMWVLREAFGLEENYLLMEPDQKEGRFILHEVMLTGNMGHDDMRDWGSVRTPVSRFFHNLRRDVYLAKHYPSEALWQPFFSLWLYAWRWSKGLLKDRDEGDY